MGLILSAHNVVNFLKEKKICPPDFQPTVPVICKESRNFNLVVQSKDSSSFLIKQSRVDSQGKTSGMLALEWLVQELIHDFSDLASIQSLISEVVLFDPSNSILVSVFYDSFIPLDAYYKNSPNYYPQVARMIGANLAQIHRSTYHKPEIKSLLGQHFDLERAKRPPHFIRKLNNLTPSLFSEICPDGLDFYKLYQRFPSLNQAILELYSHIHPSCLTHNDLTLDNFIVDPKVDADLMNIESAQVKIIDWESVYWADPAADLGMLVSQYLGEWLNSFIADPNLELNTILGLATCPLEKITPSLEEFLRGYLAVFPQILLDRPDFVSRVVQFAGIGIIDRLTYYIEYHCAFDNQALCKLQVAKNLLCNPEKGIEIVFGNMAAELRNRSNSSKPIELSSANTVAQV
ncbi:MAG: phosphotransferase [Waterburya sp.]